MEERLEKLLTSAPGPAPWYWKTFPGFRRGDESWAWQAESIGPVGEWPALHRTSDDARCFVPGFYCYAVDAGGGHLLTWRTKQRGAALELTFHQVERLEQVDMPANPRRDLDTYATRALEVLRIPPLEPGQHGGFSPRTRVELDELLLLATPPSASDHDPAVAIYAWAPKTGRVTVSPQPWFTGTTHDLGYEWVTKVVRDPESGRIVGAGIRIPAFELEDDGTTVRRLFRD